MRVHQLLYQQPINRSLQSYIIRKTIVLSIFWRRMILVHLRQYDIHVLRSHPLFYQVHWNFYTSFLLHNIYFCRSHIPGKREEGDWMNCPQLLTQLSFFVASDPNFPFSQFERL